MEVFEIVGGQPLRGHIQPAGNKNAAVSLLAATLLADDAVTLHNVPDIGDVRVMLQILETLGAKLDREGSSVTIDTTGVGPGPVTPELSSRIRASLLLAGPMVARHGEVDLGVPGGDSIGRRRNDPHWDALQGLGATIDTIKGGYRVSSGGRLRGGDVLLDEASVMATENAVMAASLAAGTTVIRNAACEPHVQDLCHLLVAMGAQITGIGSNIVTVHGVERLGGAEATIAPDHMEIGSFIGLAAVTKGELTIGPVRHEDLRMILRKFEVLGIRTETQGDNILVPAEQDLQIKLDHDGSIHRLHEAPWPGFPADLMSIVLVVATQATGIVLLHQWMFESRLYFTDRLIEMGVRIVVADPHRAVVTGPARLRGSTLQSPDIRAGMSMLMAALCAEGRSTIGNVAQIDRGYQNIDERLRSVGADIKRVGS